MWNRGVVSNCSGLNILTSLRLILTVRTSDSQCLVLNIPLFDHGNFRFIEFQCEGSLLFQSNLYVWLRDRLLESVLGLNRHFVVIVLHWSLYLLLRNHLINRLHHRSISHTRYHLWLDHRRIAPLLAVHLDRLWLHLIVDNRNILNLRCISRLYGPLLLLLFRFYFWWIFPIVSRYHNVELILKRVPGESVALKVPIEFVRLGHSFLQTYAARLGFFWERIKVISVVVQFVEFMYILQSGFFYCFQ